MAQARGGLTPPTCWGAWALLGLALTPGSLAAGGSTVGQLDPACAALLPVDRVRPVNLLLVYPIGRFCEGTCTYEVDALTDLIARVPASQLQVFVVFSPVAPEPEARTGRRIDLLPPYAIGLVDRDSKCIQAETPIARAGLGPQKLILDNQLGIVAMDFCAESEAERRAFATILSKAIRKLGPAPSPE